MRPDMNPVRVIKETKDENGITIYREWSNGYYQKSEYNKEDNTVITRDNNGKVILHEKLNDKKQVISRKWNDGYREQYAYDDNGNLTYAVNDKGEWLKRTYNENNNLIDEKGSEIY